jgi:hypothetical protein
LYAYSGHDLILLKRSGLFNQQTDGRRSRRTGA